MKNLKNLIGAILFLLVNTSTISATGNLTSVDAGFQYHNDFSGKKPAFNEVSICRLQIQVKTNSFKGAESDSPVYASLTYDGKPFYLNLSKNDRERNQTDTYDILNPDINKIKDIDIINLVINGKDGWNIREVSLLVNGISIYKKNYGAKGYWLDKGDPKRPQGLFISKHIIVKHPNFRYNSSTNNIWKGPSIISKASLENFVESAVGNSLYNVKKVTWGKKNGNHFISSKRINSNTLRFDLDLSYEINNAPNVEIDVDFDLVFTCKNGVIRTEVKNYKSNSHGTMSFLVDAMRKLKKQLYTGCSQVPDPTYAALCAGGVWGVGKLLDFNFDYEGPGKVAFSKDCTGNMKLDNYGNLILGKKNSSTTQKPIPYGNVNMGKKKSTTTKKPIPYGNVNMGKKN